MINGLGLVVINVPLNLNVNPQIATAIGFNVDVFGDGDQTVVQLLNNSSNTNQGSGFSINR